VNVYEVLTVTEPSAVPEIFGALFAGVGVGAGSGSLGAGSGSGSGVGAGEGLGEGVGSGFGVGVGPGVGTGIVGWEPPAAGADVPDLSSPLPLQADRPMLRHASRPM